MAKRLTLFILIAMVAGIVIGLILNRAVADRSDIVTITGYLSILTDLFLRLIKMIIAPLVFSTLVAGIAHMGDTTALGRIGLRSLAWFVAASLVSLTLGLLLVNLLQPGAALALAVPDATASSGIEHTPFTLKEFVTHLVPRSAIEAMANNEILQIVVFSIFVGVAITAVGERAAPVVRGVEGLVAIMLQITDYVMRFAPVAVFAAVTSAVAEQGPSILATFGYFMGGFYGGLILLWLILFAAARAIAGPAGGGPVPLCARNRCCSPSRPPRPRRRVSAHAGGAGAFRRAATDRELRAAAGLFVQSRRLDDVLHLRDDLHRPGLRPSTSASGRK